MPIIVITKDYFSGGRNITEDPDSKRELADLIIEAQTAINANTLAVGAHAARHITGGGDTIASAVAGGAAGLMTGADKTKLDGVEALADVTDATNVAAAGAVMDGDFAGATLGPMVRTGVGTYAVIQHNLVAVVAPGVGDDVVAGYGVGSKWIDTALGNVYECVDPTTGAAVWVGLSANFQQLDSRQGAAATETIRCFRALRPGRIIAVASEDGTVAAAAESMTLDVEIGGVSCLTAPITLDNAVPIDTPVAGVLAPAAVAFAAGDLITVVRTYVPGGAPTPMANTVCDVMVQYDAP